MRVLLATAIAPTAAPPPCLGEEQVNCGPDWPNDIAPDGRVRSLPTPAGKYDLAAVAAQLPSEQRPEVVVAMVDASWRNLPGNLAGFKCPKVLVVADTHHLQSPLIGMLRYATSERFDRVVFLNNRHHAAFFRAAGFRNLHWLPLLTFPHADAAVQSARQAARPQRIAMVATPGRDQARSNRLFDGLAARGLPAERQVLASPGGLKFYGSSSIGFHVSLNGELSQEVFEILSAGAALLTDRLAPGSGLERILADRRDLLVFGTPDELAERAAQAVSQPAETQAIGAACPRVRGGQGRQLQIVDERSTCDVLAHGHGHRAARGGGPGNDSSLRPGKPVCEPRLASTAERIRHRLRHVPKGELPG